VLVDVLPHVREEGGVLDARIGRDLGANRRDAAVYELVLAVPERRDDPHDGRGRFSGNAHLVASLTRDGRPFGRPSHFSSLAA
jgi:hypothetical protein